MRDRFYINPEDGSRTPVAQLPTEEIREILAAGVCIVNGTAEPGENENAVRERLLIELHIRNMGYSWGDSA